MIVDGDGVEYFVFDDHTHMGPRANPSLAFPGASFDLDAMLDDMDRSGVDMVVAFPRSNPHTDYRVQNELILGFQEQHPDRIAAFARIQPFYKESARSDIREYAQRGVRGLKFHPIIDGGNNAVNNRELMFPLMEEAAEHKLTVLIHSGSHWNCSPSLIGDLASHFPDAKFIVGHTGLWDNHQEAIATAKRVPNIYLDVSELAGPGIVRLVVREVGADRVMFGSDHPMNPFAYELGKIAKYAELSADEMHAVLGRNIARLVGIDVTTDGRGRVPVSAL
jgi:predicted TIM-barrel fold metal-dependent hydrolase